MITASLGYTQEGWKELIGTMIDMSANADMRDKLTTYLAHIFLRIPAGRPRWCPARCDHTGRNG